MIHLTLPFPPSVNRYWRHVGRRTLLSREGRQFRKRVCLVLKDRVMTPIIGALAVTVDLHPPDRRRRDADNFLKGTLDALEHAGVYENDSQITHLEVDKREPVRDGRTVVRIESYADYLARRNSTFELVCCAGCGRDTYRHVDDPADAYCERCIVPGSTHAFPENLDREPLGEPERFGGCLKHDLEYGYDDPEDDADQEL
jgi:crossover junction endodeoxyribonuclease RusA